jgi:HEAT repeat protein
VDRVDELIFTLEEDESPYQRMIAVRRLSYCDGNEKSIEAVLTALTNDEGSGVRRDCADYFSRNSHDIALRPLIAALRDEHRLVRRAAALALTTGYRSYEGLERMFIVAMEEDICKEVAALSLAEIGGEDSLGPLEALLNDEGQSVREFASMAKSKILRRMKENDRQQIP